MSKTPIISLLKTSSILKAFSRLKNDETGSSLPIWIFGLASSAFATLAVVDVGTFVSKQNNLSTAVHGAALAAANAYKGADTPEELAAVIDEAKRYFYTNFSQSDIHSTEEKFDITLTVVPTVKVVGDSRVLSVDVKANVKLSSGLFQLMRNQGSTLNAEANATRSRPLDIEVVLALDTTGSMAESLSTDPNSGSKIEALKIAISKMMDQLYGASDQAPPGIKVSIIPFSQSVNVGKLPGMAGMIKTPPGLETFVSSNWAGCISERSTNSAIAGVNIAARSTPADAFDVMDTTPTEAEPKTFWTPYYADRFVMQTYDGNNSKGLLYNWYTGGYPNPRLVTRNSTSVVHSDNGLYPGVDANTLQYQNKKYELADSYGDPNRGCSVQAMELDSTYSKSQIAEYANSLTPGGWTHTNVAMQWANRMISPQLPFNKAAAYNPTKVRKYIVLMTDGAITAGNTYSSPGRNNSNYSIDNNWWDTQYPGYTSSYGPNSISRLNTDNKASTAISAMEQRLLMACQATKFPANYSSPDGKSAVTVYNLMLGLSSSEIDHVRKIYSTCSSANEEPNFDPNNPNSKYYVEITTKEQLIDVFKSIGASISSLRFTK